MINLFSRKKPDNIVFLVGCGRSWTTVLSTLIGSCSNTHILSERRDLWHKVFPELNIWDNINSVLDFKTSDYNTKKNEKTTAALLVLVLVLVVNTSSKLVVYISKLIEN